jgi:hypothetical protein
MLGLIYTLQKRLMHEIKNNTSQTFDTKQKVNMEEISEKNINISIPSTSFSLIDSDTAYVFLYTMTLLNSDQHNSAVKDKMSVDDFQLMVKRLESGVVYDIDKIRRVYFSIRTSSFVSYLHLPYPLSPLTSVQYHSLTHFHSYVLYRGAATLLNILEKRQKTYLESDNNQNTPFSSQGSSFITQYHSFTFSPLVVALRLQLIRPLLIPLIHFILLQQKENGASSLMALAVECVCSICDVSKKCIINGDNSKEIFSVCGNIIDDAIIMLWSVVAHYIELSPSYFLISIDEPVEDDSVVKRNETPLPFFFTHALTHTLPPLPPLSHFVLSSTSSSLSLLSLLFSLSSTFHPFLRRSFTHLVACLLVLSSMGLVDQDIVISLENSDRGVLTKKSSESLFTSQSAPPRSTSPSTSSVSSEVSTVSGVVASFQASLESPQSSHPQNQSQTQANLPSFFSNLFHSLTKSADKGNPQETQKEIDDMTKRGKETIEGSGLTEMIWNIVNGSRGGEGGKDENKKKGKKQKTSEGYHLKSFVMALISALVYMVAPILKSSGIETEEGNIVNTSNLRSSFESLTISSTSATSSGSKKDVEKEEKKEKGKKNVLKTSVPINGLPILPVTIPLSPQQESCILFLIRIIIYISARCFVNFFSKKELEDKDDECIDGLFISSLIWKYLYTILIQLARSPLLDGVSAGKICSCLLQALASASSYSIPTFANDFVDGNLKTTDSKRFLPSFLNFSNIFPLTTLLITTFLSQNKISMILTDVGSIIYSYYCLLMNYTLNSSIYFNIHPSAVASNAFYHAYQNIWNTCDSQCNPESVWGAFIFFVRVINLFRPLAEYARTLLSQALRRGDDLNIVLNYSNIPSTLIIINSFIDHKPLLKILEATIYLSNHTSQEYETLAMISQLFAEFCDCERKEWRKILTNKKVSESSVDMSYEVGGWVLHPYYESLTSSTVAPTCNICSYYNNLLPQSGMCCSYIAHHIINTLTDSFTVSASLDNPSAALENGKKLENYRHLLAPLLSLHSKTTSNVRVVPCLCSYYQQKSGCSNPDSPPYSPALLSGVGASVCLCTLASLCYGKRLEFGKKSGCMCII